MAVRTMAVLVAIMAACCAAAAAASDCVALLPPGYSAASRGECNRVQGASDYCQACDDHINDASSKEACFACVMQSFHKFASYGGNGNHGTNVAPAAARCISTAGNQFGSTHATDCICRCVLNIHNADEAFACASYCANCAALANSETDMSRCACCVLEDTPPLSIGDPSTCRPGVISASVPTDCHLSPCYAGPEAAAILDMNLDSCRAMLARAQLAPAASKNDESYTVCEECTSAMGPTDVQRCYGCLYKAINAYGMRDVNGNINAVNADSTDINSAFDGCMELVRGTVGPYMQDCACECISNGVGLASNNGGSGTPEACMNACRSCARGHKAPDQCTTCVTSSLNPYVQSTIDQCLKTYK